MGLSEAQTAQGMATRHRKSVKAIVAGLVEVNALLAKMLKGNRIKWGGYGTMFDWYVRKLKETSSWTTGQLGSRTFTERDPMANPTLPYCFLDETYGVSEKSIKTNRAAGNEKIYDIQKENAEVAKSAMYRAIVDSLYSNGADDPLEPVGLAAIVGDAYESTATITVTAGKAYAGITLTTSGVSSTSNDATYSADGWDNSYWFPWVRGTAAIASEDGTTPAWSTDCVKDLAWMEHKMQRTADKSGTGKILKPDMALLDSFCWGKLIALLTQSQTTYNVPLGTVAPELANFSAIKVGGLDVVYDENVPKDVGGKGRPFILDSRAFVIETCNTKSEGLVEGQWKQNDPEVIGGVGTYKSNMGLRCSTPLAVGCIVGCDD